MLATLQFGPALDDERQESRFYGRHTFQLTRAQLRLPRSMPNLRKPIQCKHRNLAWIASLLQGVGDVVVVRPQQPTLRLDPWSQRLAEVATAIQQLGPFPQGAGEAQFKVHLNRIIDFEEEMAFDGDRRILSGWISISGRPNDIDLLLLAIVPGNVVACTLEQIQT